MAQKVKVMLDDPVAGLITPQKPQTADLKSPKTRPSQKQQKNKQSVGEDLWGGRSKSIGTAVPETLYQVFSDRMKTLGISTAWGITVAMKEFLELDDQKTRDLAIDARSKRFALRQQEKEQPAS